MFDCAAEAESEAREDEFVDVGDLFATLWEDAEFDRVMMFVHGDGRS